MGETSTVGIIGIVTLSALMFIFSFLYYLFGETFVPLLLLFAGLICAAILVFVVLFQEKPGNHR